MKIAGLDPCSWPSDYNFTIRNSPFLIGNLVCLCIHEISYLEIP